MSDEGKSRRVSSWDVTAEFIEGFAGGPAAAVSLVEERVTTKAGGADISVKWFAWRIKPDGRGWHWVELSDGWWQDLRAPVFRCAAVELGPQ